jgi:hypothetical protein
VASYCSSINVILLLIFYSSVSSTRLNSVPMFVCLFCFVCLFVCFVLFCFVFFNFISKHNLLKSTKDATQIHRIQEKHRASKIKKIKKT